MVEPNEDEQREIPIPKIGMEFETLDVAWKFYTSYVDRMSFGVTKCHLEKNTQGIVIRTYFTYCKHGKSSSNTVYGVSMTTKTGCDAHIKVTLSACKWHIYFVNNEHNHDLLDLKYLCLLRSKKRITVFDQIRITNDDMVRIGPRKTMASFFVECGGHSNVSLTQQDIRNILKKGRVLKLGVGGVEVIHEYFMDMQ